MFPVVKDGEIRRKLPNSVERSSKELCYIWVFKYIINQFYIFVLEYIKYNKYNEINTINVVFDTFICFDIVHII